MNKQAIFLKHADFERAPKDDLELLINCAHNVLSYAICQLNNGEILALFTAQHQESPLTVLEEELKNRVELQQHFDSVQVSYWTDNDLLVPDFLAANLNQQWMNYFVPSQNQHSLIPTQPIQGMVPVLSVPNQLEKLLHAAGFKSIGMHHLVEAYLPDATATTLHIAIAGGSCYFVYKSEGQLIFQKFFQIGNVDEFHYFLLFVKNQLNIDKNIRVQLSGLISEGDAYYEVVAQNFKDTGFYSPLEAYIETCLAGRLPNHYFTPLIALSTCASLAEN